MSPAIIADYLISDGERVFHIMGPSKVAATAMTPAAVRLPDGTLIYSAAPETCETPGKKAIRSRAVGFTRQ